MQPITFGIFGMLIVLALLCKSVVAEWDDAWMLQTRGGPKDTPGSIAILMAGTLNRFHLESTAKHLVAPLRAAGWNVDYFASVFVGNANVFDAEMQHVSFEKDPIFAKFEHLNQTNLSFITSVISSTLTRSGAKVPYARAFDRHDTATEDLSFIDKSMMWWRVKYGRTARENFIRMLKELEMMWHAAQKEERKQKQQYSYVLIVRDDVWWLKDFDLDLLVRTGGVQKAIGRNAGHVYSAPCKNRPTKGLVDHVFLFDRSAAEIMGLSYSRIVRPGDFGRAWLEHLEAEKPKNSENFYMQLANFSGFEINEVRGALLPMQRTGRLNSTVCLHKYCDIVDPVLPYKYVFRGAMPGILYDIPDSEPLFRCKDLATLYSAKSV